MRSNSQNHIKSLHFFTLQKPGYLLQILASLSASLILISEGMQYGWSSPVMPILESNNTPVKLNADDSAWLETTFLLSGPLALLVTPILVDKVGRHKTILLISCMSIIGWILIGAATRVQILYVARFLLGVVSDIMYTTVPMYISEIADKEIRGFLNGILYVMFYSGFIIIYAVAPLTPFYVPSIVSAGILFLQIITFWVMPESPYFFAKNQRYDSAMKSLKRLRMKDNCNIEFEEIVKFTKTSEIKSNIKETIFKKSTLKVFAWVTILVTAQHFCGFTIITMNIYTILEEAGSIYLDSYTTEILFASLMLVAMCVFCKVIDKFGRKMLLILSCTLTGINLLGLAIYFHVKNLGYHVDYFSWVPLVFIMFYALTYNIGLGMVPKILISELYSIRIKSIGMALGGGTFELSASLSILFYKYITSVWEMHIFFYIFTGTAFATALFTILIIPETKGKSLEEIQVMLEATNENT
ncbi:facilitated trehalose transporter Tret1-like [Tribolium madens]|uniref:facilitated trehalose transporter Tret1-like n=1 Tax=Tribolium madens TaxID=41895 RepID=UPI001CF75CA0|nr:facilitated trehalose transporter Tret1-like [Tribolium madens]